VFEGGALVGDGHGPVDGEALGFVDGDGVGQGDVLVEVVGGDGDPSAAVEGIQGGGAVGSKGPYGPAVTVSDPSPCAGDEPPVVVEGDDLVADANGLAGHGDALVVNAVGDGVDGVVVRRGDHDGVTGASCLVPGVEGGEEHFPMAPLL